jgi:HEAT repeat protein
MQRLMLAAALILCMTSNTALAQWSWPVHAMHALDSALLVIGMSRADLAMPPDLALADVHRRPIHDRSFAEPLAPYDDLEAMHAMLLRRTPEALDSAMIQWMASMDLGDAEREHYDATMSAREIAARMGVDPERVVGFIGATFLLRYIGAVMSATDAMQPAREQFLQQPLLVDLCDSLWMNSTESEAATLWQLHDDEIRTQARTRAFVARANPRQLSSVYRHGWSLYQQLMTYSAQVSVVREMLLDSIVTVTIETPAGRIALGGKGNDTYVGSYLLIVDLGGNDTYSITSTTKDTALAYPARCIVDIAGNDTYLGSGYDLGSGIGGVGILIDRDGDDIYRAGDQSLGCGIFGIGIVHDLAGNDSYISGQNTQGCGIFGIGLLLDDSGFDTYKAHAQAQGFGGTRGVGVLDDRSGNDAFLAVSPFVDVLRYEAHHVTFTQGAALGIRPIASGGIGLLFDHAGNDLYLTDIYGQGTAYWYGIGALIDDAGEDRYQAYQYAQGSGVHFASALLRDRSGDDVYVSHGVSQGCGHDVATGILLDERGNDSYVCESLSLGGGNANAVSILLDAAGNDSYVAMNESNTMGFSDYRRGYGMIGLFIDAQGDDRYTSSTKNNTTSVKSTYGAFTDLNLPVVADVSSPSPRTAASATQDRLTLTVDSLMVQASAAPLRFQQTVKPARNALIAMGGNAIPRLAGFLGTQMPRERLALEEVIPEIYKTSPDAVRSLLSDSLSSSNSVTVSTALTLCGKIKDPLLVHAVAPLAEHPRWQHRRNAVHALQEIGDTAYMPVFRIALRDTHAYVRARSAYAVGLLGGAEALRLLEPALQEESQMVRHAAIEGLSRGQRRQAAALVGFWRSLQDRRHVTSTLRLLSCSDTTKADVKAIQSWYRSAATWQRSAMERLLPSMPVFWHDNVIVKPKEGRRARSRSSRSKSESRS